MPDAATLEINCQKCGGALSMELGASPKNALPVRQSWLCPYCQCVYEWEYDSPILWVVERTTDEPSEPQ